MKRRLHLILGVLLSVCCLPFAAMTAANVNLQGNLVSSTNPATQAGIYAFSVNSPFTMTPVNTSANIVANGGGVYVDGKFYFMNYTQQGSLTMAYYYVYDAVTWEQLSSSYPSIARASDIAVATAYDKTTGTVYCCTQNDAQTAFLLRTWNLENNQKTTVAEVGTGYLALAVSTAGQLYGISPEGKLYSIDKTSGEATLIGNTGFIPSGMQSATFDDAGGKLYWFAYNNEASRLYEVNTSTAGLTLISDLPDLAEIVSAYVAKPEAEDKAPARAEQLTLHYPDGTLEGQISFRIPSVCFDGSAMTEDVGYSIEFNGTEVVRKSGVKPGSEVREPWTVANAGTYEVKVVLNNAVGNSPAEKTQAWIGNDTPKPVSGLKIEKTGDKTVNLSWETVAEGVHGGYVNAEEIRYQVVRQPDGTVVAEALSEPRFTEEVAVEEMTAYRYEVCAHFAGQTSAAVKSKYVTFGTHVSIPFYDNFDTDATFPLYTVIDGNQDMVTWTYDAGEKALYCRTKVATDNDEYAVTPPLSLEKGSVYNLSFEVRKLSVDKDTQCVEVLIGTSPEVGAMTKVLLECQDIDADRVLLKEFSVDNDGLYYIAFHLVTPPRGIFVYLDNIKVEGTIQNAPAEVTELTVTPAEQGELKAAISFRAPEKLVNGEAAESLTKAELYRESTLIHTFENPVPGDVLTFTDEAAKQGFNNYRVFAYNANGIGKMAECRVYVGVDIPGLAQNVRFTDNGDGSFAVVWEAPSVGANNGYVIADDLTYDLFRCVGSEVVKVASGVKELSATDTYEVEGELQSILYYKVCATNEFGTGKEAMSNILQIGNPYPAPLAESFHNAALATAPWVVDRIVGSDDDVLWTLLRKGADGEISQDDGGGFAGFAGYVNGGKAVIVSPKIDISTLEKPGVAFYAQMPYADVAFTPVISVDNGEYQPLRETIYRDAAFQKGWAYVVIPLKDYKAAKQVRIGFMGEIRGENGAMYVDNVHIDNFYDNDLAIDAFTGPNVAREGEVCRFTVSVVNLGLKASEATVVKFSKDGEEIGSRELPLLQPGEQVAFDLEYAVTLKDRGTNCVFRVEIGATDDNVDNNSAKCVVPVKTNNYPVPVGLSGDFSNGQVELVWSEPDYKDGMRLPATDDFESYDAFIISGIGDYILHDIDKSMTYRLGDTKYDNSTAQMAFQVFNPEKAKITDAAFIPHSGKQMLIAVASLSKVNDDWLITPELSADSREVSFFAKSFTAKYGLEEFEVWYSEGGTTPDDFVKLSEKTLYAPTEWTEFVFILPEAARHFAIRYVSSDKYALAIDDFTFAASSAEPSMLTLNGYNIYRDGQRVNEAPLAATAFTDKPEKIGEYVYNVSAVYDMGESVLSDDVRVTVSSHVSALTSETLVFGTKEGIRVLNSQGAVVRVNRMDGVMVETVVAESDDLILPVESGVYVVTVNGNTTKVIVK